LWFIFYGIPSSIYSNDTKNNPDVVCLAVIIKHEDGSNNQTWFGNNNQTEDILICLWNNLGFITEVIDQIKFLRKLIFFILLFLKYIRKIYIYINFFLILLE